MELISLKEFADKKKVSRQTVHSLIKSRKIKTSEFLGKKVVIYDEDAKNWKPEQGKRTDINEGHKYEMSYNEDSKEYEIWRKTTARLNEELVGIFQSKQDAKKDLAFRNGRKKKGAKK